MSDIQYFNIRIVEHDFNMLNVRRPTTSNNRLIPEFPSQDAGHAFIFKLDLSTGVRLTSCFIA